MNTEVGTDSRVAYVLCVTCEECGTTRHYEVREGTTSTRVLVGFGWLTDGECFTCPRCRDDW